MAAMETAPLQSSKKNNWWYYEKIPWNKFAQVKGDLSKRKQALQHVLKEFYYTSSNSNFHGAPFSNLVCSEMRKYMNMQNISAKDIACEMKAKCF